MIEFKRMSYIVVSDKGILVRDKNGNKTASFLIDRENVTGSHIIKTYDRAVNAQKVADQFPGTRVVLVSESYKEISI